MGIISIISAFLRQIYFSAMGLLRMSKSGGSSMQIFYAAFAILAIVTFAYYLFFRITLSRKEIALLFAVAILLISFTLVPRVLYGPYNENFRSQFLVVFSGTLPAFLIGIVLRRSDKINSMCKCIPWAIIFFTITSVIVSFFSSSSTSGGYISDKSGLNYQDISYITAFAFALNLFYLKNKHNIIETGIFRKKGSAALFYCFIPLHVITLLIDGGRGAFLLMLVMVVYYFLMDHRNVKKNLDSIVLLFIAAVIILIIVPRLDIKNSGLDRILSLFSGSGDEGRKEIRDQAMDFFVAKPVFGYGAGSVLYLFEAYTHNFFTDIMVEFGTIGVIAAVIILGVVVKKSFEMVKSDPRNHLIVIIFICNFTMLMFSGYYFSQVSLWFAIGYIFSTAANPNEKIHNLYLR